MNPTNYISDFLQRPSFQSYFDSTQLDILSFYLSSRKGIFIVLHTHLANACRISQAARYLMVLNKRRVSRRSILIRPRGNDTSRSKILLLTSWCSKTPIFLRRLRLSTQHEKTIKKSEDDILFPNFFIAIVRCPSKDLSVIGNPTDLFFGNKKKHY